MKLMFPSIFTVAALTLVFSSVSPSPAIAQPAAAAAAAPATTRYQVTVVRIKPDMLNEWIDLQKNEVVPA